MRNVSVYKNFFTAAQFVVSLSRTEWDDLLVFPASVCMSNTAAAKTQSQLGVAIPHSNIKNAQQLLAARWLLAYFFCIVVYSIN